VFDFILLSSNSSLVCKSGRHVLRLDTRMY